MGRIDEIKFLFPLPQSFESGNISFHIPVKAEHINISVFLNRVSADQASFFFIQHSNAAGRMTRYMDYFDSSSAEVNQIPVKNREHAPFPLLNFVVHNCLRRMHIELVKSIVPAGVVPVGVRIEQHEGKIGCLPRNVTNRQAAHPGINDQRLFLSGQNKNPYAIVIHNPCILI